LLSKTHAKLRNRISKVNFENIADLFEDNTIFDSCDSVEDEIRILESRNLSWWAVYPFQLVKYAKYLKEHNKVKLPLKYIEYTGAFLCAEERLVYESLFSCKMINNYSCREVWSIAYDCEQGNLHVNTDSIYFELIDDDGNIISDVNKVGRVVVTSLKQRVMPFVRYETGDYAYYEDIKCECGCTDSIISLVPKRDLIYGTDILGSVYFQAVISDLVQEYKMLHYESIYVEQNELNIFSVYVIKNGENKEEIEKYFSLCARDKLVDAIFKFFYVDYSEKKGIFQKSIK
jgi:phenylacetate-CoA ligase